MNCIKRLKIHGFKKFSDFEVDFNEDINILVGDNESGKSTLLDAIDIVLRQKYKSYDKYIIRELLNQDAVKEFATNPGLDTLPFVSIDMELRLDNVPVNGMFFGMNHNFDKNASLYGISFKCALSDEFKIDNGVMEIIERGRIPYEYYQMSWNTFQGETYKVVKKPLNYMVIDSDNVDTLSSYNYYCRALFAASHSEVEQTEIKDGFRSGVQDVFSGLDINDIGDLQSFGVNDKKMIFENIITILDEGIPIANKGGGRENVIKTKIAIEKAGSLDVLAIEEPETHLGFLNLRKMLKEIQLVDNRQLIVTTHESMIASGLNIRNILWMKNEYTESLKDISRGDAEFFLRAPSNNLLQFILSTKVILVEGPTEFMLVPVIFKKICGRSIDEAGINVISCDGISYERFLGIAKETNKRVAIITDNDGKQSVLDKMNNSLNDKQIRIFTDESLDNWTWEVCFYNLNKQRFEEEVEIQKGAKYLFHNTDYGEILGKMLNDKVETAYQMFQKSGGEFDYEIPSYIKKACEWINEQY